MLLLVGCSSLTNSNLPSEQCRFIRRLQTDSPGIFQVHETYPNISCSKYQSTFIWFITNMPVGWNPPDGGTNWIVYLTIDGVHQGNGYEYGLFTGISFPTIPVPDSGIVSPNIPSDTLNFLPTECPRVYNEYYLFTGFAFLQFATTGPNQLLSDGQQFRLRLDICDPELHDGSQTCIQSNEELVTVRIINELGNRPDCDGINPNQPVPDPGSY